MEFEIKKGVPLPKGRGKPRKYDIDMDSLEVDEMILVAMPRVKVREEHKTIRNFVLRYTHKNPNKKFTVRQIDTDKLIKMIGGSGIGIWRTK